MFFIFLAISHFCVHTQTLMADRARIALQDARRHSLSRAVRVADQMWNASTRYACTAPAPARAHIIWRWCTFGKWCWREVALQAHIVAKDAVTNVSHAVLGWVHGTWAGQSPWWVTACAKRATFSLSRHQRDQGRCELSMWQAPTCTFAGRPHQVSHAWLASQRGTNASSNTVWMVLNDTTRRGHCPATPQGYATVFDMQIQAFVLMDLMREDVQMALMETPLPRGFRAEWMPRALYHGTGGDLRWLNKQGGVQLRPSARGMLGPGVYVGSFTKAVRFAGFARNAAAHTEYSQRKWGEMVGILRVLVFVAEDKIKWLNKGGRDKQRDHMTRWTVSFPTHKRKRDDAMKNRSNKTTVSQAKAWTDAQRKPFVDHTARWRKQQYDAVALLPTCVGVNPHSGKLTWVVRNEEWCTRAAITLVRHVADLHVTSVALNPWQPWRRAAAIR